MFIAVLMTEGTIFISEVVVQRKNLKKWTQQKKTRKKNMNLQFVNSKFKEATRSTLVDV
jgi:hypothetical protein